MNKDEIKQFLNNKPGYIKEGGKRLRNHLLNKGFTTTINLCKQALKEVRLENNTTTNKIQNNQGKILIYDIETSYNIGKFWRAGYNLNINPGDIIHERAIICISYKWLGEEQVYNLTWDKNQCDKFLLEQFIPILDEADMIVAHNGDRYDLNFPDKPSGTYTLATLDDIKKIDLTGRVYENNAEAISGGLTFNDVYITSTGELRIVV